MISDQSPVHPCDLASPRPLPVELYFLDDEPSHDCHASPAAFSILLRTFCDAPRPVGAVAPAFQTPSEARTV